jgi:hypothetical protein
MPAGNRLVNHRSPEPDEQQRHSEHPDQLADEHRFERHRGGEHLDHLVVALLRHRADRQAGQK